MGLLKSLGRFGKIESTDARVLKRRGVAISEYAATAMGKSAIRPLLRSRDGGASRWRKSQAASR